MQMNMQANLQTLECLPFSYSVCGLCSLTDRRSFDSLAEWVTEFRKYSQLPDDVPSPIVVLGNKVLYRQLRSKRVGSHRRFLVRCALVLPAAEDAALPPIVRPGTKNAWGGPLPL
jgi:hypothetical protein